MFLDAMFVASKENGRFMIYIGLIPNLRFGYS